MEVDCEIVAHVAQYQKTPRTMSGAALKTCKMGAKAYEALAEAFQHLNNLAKLKAQVNAGSSEWAEVSRPPCRRVGGGRCFGV